MTRTSQKNDRFAQLAGALLLAAITAAGLLADAQPAAADAACVVDTGSADDINATQKDLNEFCLSAGNNGALSGCSSADANLTWTWDDTGFTGSNTADACALYDTDADGNANFALCASIENNPAVESAGSPRFYLCDDSKTLNCGGASTVATAASACAVSNVADVFTGEHQAGNPCTGDNCSTRDTQVQCCVKNGDFPSGSAPELIDVCSYPSSSPSSSPSECVKTVLCTTDVDCSELTDACNVGSCASDGLTKRCVATPKTNGTACDDSDACTETDTCQAGVCTGDDAIVCEASDQCHDAGTCDPATGVCSDPAKQDGASCDDGDACTQTDSCQSGSCGGSDPVECTASDQCHDAGTCDPSTGVCSDPARGDGATCNDGDACTQTDTCQGGICGGANPVTCSALDQCHAAGTCDPSTGVCSNPSKADGSTCSDGNACTQTDTCQSGTCGGANPVTCSPLDQCHDAGTCNTTTGICSNPAKANGSTCNDGNACTGTDSGDHCDGSGQCVPGTAVVCAAGDTCHEAGTCDPATGQCSAAAKPSGTPCSDGNACTGNAGGDRCDGSGQCVPGAAVECAAPDACHEAGTCDPATGQCAAAAKPSGTPCSDGNACTGGNDGDRCDGSGQCVPGAAVECAAPDACHEAGTCDPATGHCAAAAKPSGTPCSDGNACTGNAGGEEGDRCDGSGQCVPGSAVECAGADACHEAGVCDPATGECSAAPKPSGTPCSDGDACTGADDGDRCDGDGQCVPGAAVVCAAADDCHEAGTCDPTTGKCSESVKAAGSECTDGNPCTLGDACDGNGACTAGAPRDCSSDDPCHESGTCDVTTGTCVVTPKAVDCGDAVCSNDPACVEICDNCVDDNGDGQIDRDDPTCMPFADGLGAGTGDPKKRGAGVAKCQSAIQAAGVRLASVTRVRLQQCADAVFRCIQQKADDPTCLTKARARCVKQAEALADGPRSLAARLRIKIAKSCGPKKAGLPPRVSREDLCDATGLGFLGEIAACDDPNTPAAAVLDELADHLVHEERCRIAQLFTASTPRGAELLTLGDLHMSDDECLGGERDRATLGLASPLGKAAAKCEKAIGSSSTRFFNRMTSSYRRCATAVFRCVQKSNDPRCQAKAERRCQKLTATLFEGPRSAEARMRTTVARACGPRKGKPVLLGPVQMSELAGLGYDALESRCNALGVAGLQSLDDIDECMVRQYVCRAEQVLTSQMPRTHELLDLGKARRR